MILAVPAQSLFEAVPLEQYIERYNQNINSAPEIVRPLLGSERVQIDITLINSSIMQLGLQTEGGLVVGVVNGGFDDPTIEVFTNERVIQNISSSDDPIAEFSLARAIGDVEVRGNSISSRIRLGLLLSSTDVLGFFYRTIYG